MSLALKQSFFSALSFHDFFSCAFQVFDVNASPDEICEAVVVRGGQDPIVFNLDLHTPEPASARHRGMPFHPDR
jgi:hypothetical protein